jgi:hypothetical protein
MTGPPESERRRAERVYFEPLRVRVHGTREGILVDLSESGALLLFAAALPVDRQLALQIEWKDRPLDLQARVTRCLPHHVQLASATLARTEYDVALEFVDPPREAVTLIREIIQKNASARGNESR